VDHGDKRVIVNFHKPNKSRLIYCSLGRKAASLLYCVAFVSLSVCFSFALFAFLFVACVVCVLVNLAFGI
jgi:hypothetical protein